jgi:hypothetical protein
MSSGERRCGNPSKVSNPMTGQPVPSYSITRDRNMVVPSLNIVEVNQIVLPAHQSLR